MQGMSSGTAEKKRKAAGMLRGGMSAEEVSGILGMHIRTVRKYQREEGIYPKEKNGAKAETQAAWAAEFRLKWNRAANPVREYYGIAPLE